MQKEEKKKKKKLRWQVKLVLYIIMFVLYLFFIGTKGIFIKEFKIKNEDITNDLHGIKIVHISDIHYGSSTTKTMIKKIVNKINSSKPDIVIFTGDLLNKRKDIKEKDIKFLIKELSKIKSEYGSFYVKGEEDNDISSDILKKSNFIDLNESEQKIYIKRSSILLIGDEKTKAYFENNKEDKSYKILSMHNPDYINENKEYNFNLALAGHTHNGQVNIFKLKELFISSKYKKTYQKINKTDFYISPGIGTSNVNVRLFNHPTIYLYRLNKAS